MNIIDSDDDGDGIPTLTEGPFDPDGDGYYDLRRTSLLLFLLRRILFLLLVLLVV